MPALPSLCVPLYWPKSSLSPSTINNTEYRKVQKFRDKFKNRGLYWSYSDLENFRNLLRQHVTATLNSLIQEQGEQIERQKQTDDDSVSITLSSNYWIVVLGALDGLHHKFVQPRLAEMRKRGIDHTQLSKEETTALAGPIRALGMIVTQLAEKGIMTEQAN